MSSIWLEKYYDRTKRGTRKAPLADKLTLLPPTSKMLRRTTRSGNKKWKSTRTGDHESRARCSSGLWACALSAERTSGTTHHRPPAHHNIFLSFSQLVPSTHNSQNFRVRVVYVLFLLLDSVDLEAPRLPRDPSGEQHVVQKSEPELWVQDPHGMLQPRQFFSLPTLLPMLLVEMSLVLVPASLIAQDFFGVPRVASTPFLPWVRNSGVAAPPFPTPSSLNPAGFFRDRPVPRPWPRKSPDAG